VPEMLPLIFVLLVQSSLPSQPPAPPAPAAAQAAVQQVEKHGLPGTLPGTERWLVTFKARSFDLRAFEAAVAAKDAARVEAVVKDLERRAAADQAPFAELVGDLGGRVVTSFWLINCCAIEIPHANLGRVRAHANVLYLHADEMVYPLIKDATDAKNHNADAVQAQGFKGKGVAVAIMDTGLDENTTNGTANRPHRTFYVNGDTTNQTGGGIKGSRLLANVQIGTISADNSHPHGTGCAGIAAGGDWGTSGSDHGHSYDSGIVGYSISLNTSGGSDFTTIAKAWQQVAADKVKYNIVACNNSYSGSPDPLNPSQQALDTAALTSGVLPVVAAGNNGASTANSQACANGVAVGACNRGGARTIASFSSRGPMSGDTARFYPDVCANGVDTVMPQNENETINWTASGTSMASPQVCGAAAVYRSIQTSATSLETKAALLATPEDVSKQNSSLNRNAYGMGYLRDDFLLLLAQGRGTTAMNAIASTTTPVQVPYTVTKGKGYSIVIAWNRHDVTKTTWSDLNLEVVQGTQSLGVSNTPRNLYEKVVILAPNSGPIFIRVSATTLEQASVPFAVAVAEVPPPFVDGRWTAYGQGCLGTGQVRGAETVLPMSLRGVFGSSGWDAPLGQTNHRLQQVFATNEVPAAFTAIQMVLRLDNTNFPGPITGYWAELKIDMGYCPNAPTALSATYASNVAGTPTNVLATKRVNLPDFTARNASANDFRIKIGLDRPFTYTAQSGRWLLVDFSKTNSSAGAGYTAYYVDCVNDAAPRVSCVHSLGHATSGNVYAGFGAVLGFNSSLTGAVPLIECNNVPQINSTVNIQVAQALASSAAVFSIGSSDQTWGPIPLPFDLTNLGAPGCTLLTGQEIPLVVATDVSGSGTLPLPIPNSVALVTTNFYVQAMVIDLKANKLGLVFTNGLKAFVGGQP
jgi:hypothetical protein